MSDKVPSVKISEVSVEEGIEENSETTDLVKGIRAGSKAQTRFQFITSKGLSKETVAGIKDMNLGKAGKSVIRIDSGANTGHAPHVNLDPRGFPSGKNPHIPVPAGVVSSARFAQQTIQHAGKALTLLSLVVDTYRLGNAAKQDYDEFQKSVDDIAKLESAIRDIKEALQDESLEGKVREELERILRDCEEALEQVRRHHAVPENSIKTASSVAGGWAGGLAAGASGAWLGTQTGAAIGAIGGPPGVLIGSLFGAVFGGISGGISGSILGSKGAELAAQATLEGTVGQKKNYNIQVNK